MTWKTDSFAFVAGQGPTSTITLTSTNPGNGGVFFDAVNVSAAPEPGTWAMMLVGLGGLGAMLRTRRRPVASAAAA
jgi:PEP-CTERM motif